MGPLARGSWLLNLCLACFSEGLKAYGEGCCSSAVFFFEGLKAYGEGCCSSAVLSFEGLKAHGLSLAAAKALEENLCKKGLQAADAGAAANTNLDAHTLLATSEAQAFECNFLVFSVRAAAATAAALCEETSFNIFLGHTIDSCWIFWGHFAGALEMRPKRARKSELVVSWLGEKTKVHNQRNETLSGLLQPPGFDPSGSL